LEVFGRRPPVRVAGLVRGRHPKTFTKPARIFPFEEIQAAHRLMESNQAGGKIVVRL
jgi:NADPH:quinone reductase-like Zn-dependent oxidoreductase